MVKDAEIEQVLSLPNEKWQRKKLRLPHSQKRDVEKPQKRRSRESTLLKPEFGIRLCHKVYGTTRHDISSLHKCEWLSIVCKK